jgi:hypothetical protein
MDSKIETTIIARHPSPPPKGRTSMFRPSRTRVPFLARCCDVDAPVLAT